eukprot:TRINITY_DN86_c0_g1_i4.p1 TRINITY_DN86_c0_g1~~TRINITY_DN86_c0_g1_i4.p1  ORF type:complete len:535 (+),score=99.05 TRINITY_DN86_c0_g1_i4:34-1605(+)
MLSRLLLKPLKAQARNFVAMWPPIKGSKILGSVDEALSTIKDGSSILVGGYGKLGAPLSLIEGLAKKKTKDLTLVTATACCSEKSCAIQSLLENGQVSRLMTSHVGDNPVVKDLFKRGQLELILEPLGNITEMARSGGYGVPGFYSHIGVGTYLQYGGVPQKMSADGKIIQSVNVGKQMRNFHNKDTLFNRTFLCDYSFVKSWKADEKGNAVLKLANQNTNRDFSIAGKVCILESEEISKLGDLDGDDIQLPCMFVHKVVKSTVSCNKVCSKKIKPDYLGTGETRKINELMAKRAAQEVSSGYCVLGNGIAKGVEQFVKSDIDVFFVAPETGLFGVQTCTDAKDVNPDLLDGDHYPVKLRKHAATSKSSDMFAAIRGGHMNLVVMEAYQVSETGDIANIQKEGEDFIDPGIKMDLAGCRSPLVAMMPMTTNGKPNLVPKCELQLSGTSCVSKLITDMGVFEFRQNGMTLVELAPKVTVDQIKSKTACKFQVASDLKTMALQPSSLKNHPLEIKKKKKKKSTLR